MRPIAEHRRDAAVAALATAALLGLACASSAPPTDADKAADPALAERRARMHYDVGVERLTEGRSAAALRELLQAERYNPGDPWIHLALAEAFRRKGRLEDAEQHLLSAIEADPEFHKAHLNVSALYIQMERYEDSLRHAELLLADPTFEAPWRAHTNLGWAKLQLGDPVAAREHLESALDFHDRYWPARLNLGILEAEHGSRLEAQEHFERVLDAKPGPFAEAEVHYRLAEIHVSLGQRERAIDHLTAAVAQRPSGPWGERSADYLKLLQ
ncbi:MAG: tetratricopeptide repeat protein [Myxococcota bacterium]|nr:tetratricopeptide repeat protein [Myxococcota bacterium]